MIVVLSHQFSYYFNALLLFAREAIGKQAIGIRGLVVSF